MTAMLSDAEDLQNQETTPLKKGDPVVISEKGLSVRPKHAGKRGVVLSPRPRLDCVTVKWEHLKTPERLHVTFLARAAPPS